LLAVLAVASVVLPEALSVSPALREPAEFVHIIGVKATAYRVRLIVK